MHCTHTCTYTCSKVSSVEGETESHSIGPEDACTDLWIIQIFWAGQDFGSVAANPNPGTRCGNGKGTAHSCQQEDNERNHFVLEHRHTSKLMYEAAAHEFT